MSNQFIGEIRIFGGNFAPLGWSFCNGAVLPISENDTLFNLIGTTYGGDGVQTFNLPDLQGRVPVHQGNGFVIGQTGGAESVTLNTNQMPSHNHLVQVQSGAGTQSSPANNVWASSSLNQFATTGVNPVTAMAANLIGTAGNSLPHDNMMPFVAISFILALSGIYPTQT